MIKIELSGETYGKAYSKFFPIRKEIESLLKKIEDKDYGHDLSIGIIPIIMPEENLENWGKEWKFYKRKKKEAMIKQSLDYKLFVCSKPEKQKEILVGFVIESLEYLRDKVDKDFQFEQMILDVKDVLKVGNLDNDTD